MPATGSKALTAHARWWLEHTHNRAAAPSEESWHEEIRPDQVGSPCWIDKVSGSAHG